VQKTGRETKFTTACGGDPFPRAWLNTLHHRRQRKEMRESRAS